jgi:CubicO group peptidase (beta-lactamase class C family)
LLGTKVTNVVGYVAIVDQLASVAGGLAQTATDAPPAGTQMASNLLTNVASVSKILTTIGVLQSLASNGLTLDTPISPYIYSGSQGWSQGSNISTITFKQLLTHTAGIRPLNINGSEYCNDNNFNTAAYADLKMVIETGVNSSDIGVPAYNNCNFAIFRELLPVMQGNVFSYSPSSSQSFDMQRAAWSASLYISYINQNVLQPVGISQRTCSPPATGTPDILSYPNPAGTTAGNNWDDWTLLCGGGGWSLSASDLLSVISSLANDNVLLTNTEKTQMNSACLGWDCSTRSDCPNPYPCKNGALSNTKSGDTLHTYVGIFKCNIPVVVIVNSPLPQPYQNGSDIIGLVNNAYWNAIVPGTPTPCQ